MFGNNSLTSPVEEIDFKPALQKEKRQNPELPQYARHMTPMEASQQLKNFMSTIKDGVLDLKITHDYYLQIQGQMALAGATWCDFVIYTKKGVSVQRIRFDEKFWESKARLLSSFFVQYFLPKFVELKEHPQR